MAKALFLAPTGLSSGLTSVALGLVRGLDRLGIRVGFFKPISYGRDQSPEADLSLHFAREKCLLSPPLPIPLKHAQSMISQNKLDRLMEDIVGLYNQVAESFDMVVVEGLVPDRSEPYTAKLNVEIARNLNADVVLVASARAMDVAQLDDHLDLAARLFAAPEDPDVAGCVLNKINSPGREHTNLSLQAALEHAGSTPPDYRQCTIFQREHFKLLGQIPWSRQLIAPRTRDVARHLNASPIEAGEWDTRRVNHIAICARTLPNVVASLTPGALVVTPGDREDIIVATAMAAMNGVPLAGLILTGGLQPDARTMKLCARALATGLPLLTVDTDTYHTASALANMNMEVPHDDLDRMEAVMDTVAAELDNDWLREHCASSREIRLSPPAFRYQLVQRARAARKTIVLPEGDEPRTVQAAVICQQRGIANCILLAKPDAVQAVADAQGVTLPSGLQIIDPDSVRAGYVEPMVALRKHKGLNADMAIAQLEDTVVLGTMMLAQGEVDGLVSGAVHTTANTVRPALQLIKTRADARVVSSVFFMCLPEQVLVYGDCAINPDPDAETLADIAIQSADSALAFGVAPRVAMISYSTGASGSGADVDKVRQATAIAQQRRPDLIIDGPLQYDAAAIESVARSKAPDSPVAGKATVFIFPDLNTGNTTYKAVQRSANVISIGPMLQGLRMPVNDLSRGALIDDIVYTIALTAIQAHAVQQDKPQDTR